jgi:hypothetical protein
LEAAERVCSDTTLPMSAIPPVHAELVTKSWVAMEIGDARALPFRCLETIRAYTAERLDQELERQRLEHAHAAFFAATLAELHDLSKLKGYFGAVDRNRTNLYHAMQRSLGDSEAIQTGHCIAMGLHTYWSHRAMASEGREWQRSFLVAEEQRLPRPALAGCMLKIAEYSASLGQGGGEEAVESRRKARAIYQELGDRISAASSWPSRYLSVVSRSTGQRTARGA